jgi:hypothetical protein
LINGKFISLRTIRSKKREEKTGAQSLGNQIGVMYELMIMVAEAHGTFHKIYSLGKVKLKIK